MRLPFLLWRHLAVPSTQKAFISVSWMERRMEECTRYLISLHLVQVTLWYLSSHEQRIKISGGNSPAVQWLGLSAFTCMALVKSLVGELRFYKMQGTTKKIKKGVFLVQNGW